MSDNAQSPYRIQTVRDALRVLEALVGSGDPLTAIQLSLVTGVSRNRTFRLLKTLEESGYVRSESDSAAHRPTLKLFSLGQNVAALFTIESLARPVLDKLCREVHETVYLTMRQGDDVVCLLTIESMRTVRITAQPGSRWQLGRGAAGEALLLGANHEDRCQFVERHPEINERWQRISERYQGEGVTYVDGREGRTTDEDVIAMGIPIHDARGDAHFAMCVSWPVGRVAVDIGSLKAALRQSAVELEGELGYRPIVDVAADSGTSGFEKRGG